ncbi:hypothetical protein Dsin_015705 [Dipteronia sinensis]|uniref:Reverse transcriptase n=1 Tax=Dipteronia sinensis TaxID=43782 RepID=A0AAE0ABT3_9ROSI|nr:hypothetical protein Dsin_015705 [Dipteronia sinensis]
MLNGEVCGNLTPTRGLRQEDPMSHYLFIICAEGLSCLINSAQVDGNIKGFNCSKNDPAISHLFFADDNLVFTKANSVNCLAIRDVLDRLKGWGEKSFSIGEKYILIKAVIQSLHAYAMSIFKLPKGLIKEIQRLYARFWWGSTADKRKIHWCSWTRLCTNKAEGGEGRRDGGRGEGGEGLGFRNLENFNKALLAKQGLRILKQPDSLATMTLKG